MKYKLNKKKSFFKLFHSEIKFISIIIVVLSVLIIGVLNWRHITYFIYLILKLIAKILSYKTFWNFVNYSAMISFALYLLIKIGVYLCRHTYIPLTKEELEVNNINTLEDYNNFLYKFFLRRKPLTRVRDEITTTAKQYLLTEDEDESHLNDLYFLNNDYYMNWFDILIFMVVFFALEAILLFLILNSFGDLCNFLESEKFIMTWINIPFTLLFINPSLESFYTHYDGHPFS